MDTKRSIQKIILDQPTNEISHTLKVFNKLNLSLTFHCESCELSHPKQGRKLIKEELNIKEQAMLSMTLTNLYPTSKQSYYPTEKLCYQKAIRRVGNWPITWKRTLKFTFSITRHKFNMTPELTQSPESFLAKFQDPSFSTPITIQLSDLYYGAKTYHTLHY